MSAGFTPGARVFDEAAFRTAEAREAKLVDALQKIARNEVEVFDESVGHNVWVSMDMDEAVEIARAALAKARGEA